jgi:hypothetical protein
VKVNVAVKWRMGNPAMLDSYTLKQTVKYAVKKNVNIMNIGEMIE